MGMVAVRESILERIVRDNPKLHYASDEAARAISAQGYRMEAGPFNMAVSPEVLAYIAKTVKNDDVTIETGIGHTTIILSALAKHHTSIMYPEPMSENLVKQYMREVGIPLEKVTVIMRPSDTALPTLTVRNEFDFAFIDGCHGYPFPALDWHYIDPMLKVGAIIGFDDVYIPAVRVHCEFLEANGSYELVERVDGHAHFYVKLRDEEREWVCQPFNRPRPPSTFSKVSKAFSLLRQGKVLTLADKVAKRVRVTGRASSSPTRP